MFLTVFSCFFVAQKGCFCVEGYDKKLFSSQFFDEIENLGCTRYDKTYKITITKKSLRKLDKELKKYKQSLKKASYRYISMRDRSAGRT